MARRTLGALVLVLPLAGCGGNNGGGAAAPTNAIERAAAKTSRAGSTRADFTISGSAVSGTGSGVFDGNGDGQLTMDLTTGGQQMAVDTVLADHVVYLRSPALSQHLPPGKEWIKLDLAKVAKEQKLNLNGLLETNPTLSGALSYLLGSKKIEKLGSQTVEGVPTRHYRVTVDLRRAADRASGSDRDALRQALAATGTATQPVDVWIDSSGYVRRLQFETHAASSSTKLTMQLHDFGSPVPISAPSTNQVVDLLQALMGTS